MSRERFPLNIHSEVSMTNEGVSPKTKKSIMRVFLAVMVMLLTWSVWQILSGTPFRVLGSLIGLVLSIVSAVVLWNKVFVNQYEAKFEESHANKIFKFFKLVLSDSHKDIEEVQTIRFISGEYAAALSISIGNITVVGEQLTEDFFDKLFLLCHRQQIRIKIFTLKDEWDMSEMHLNYLKRLSLLHDKKLRDTLSKIDAYQSEIFKSSFVNRIVIMFVVPSNRFEKLKTITSYVNTWGESYLKMSSIRAQEWGTCSEIVKWACEFLGTKMIDVSPLADKERKVVLDIRKLVRPYRTETFYAQASHQMTAIDTNARFYRTSKFAVKDGKK